MLSVSHGPYSSRLNVFLSFRPSGAGGGQRTRARRLSARDSQPGAAAEESQQNTDRRRPAGQRGTTSGRSATARLGCFSASACAISKTHEQNRSQLPGSDARTLSLSLSLSLSLTHSHSHSLTHTLSLSLTHSLTLSLSLTHTHTHTHSLTSLSVCVSQVQELSTALQEKADWCSELLLSSEQLQRDVCERDEEIETQGARLRELEHTLTHRVSVCLCS